MQVLTFLAVLILGTTCKMPVQKDLPEAQENPGLKIYQGYGNVSCSLSDKAGNLWFGTTDNGLYKYNGKAFTQFTINEGLNSNDIASLMEDKDGKIWIGTEAGPCVFDGTTFTPIPIPLPKDLPPNPHANKRNAHRVFNMMQSKSGKRWFVTMDGVYIYDGNTFTLFEIDKNAKGFMTNNDKAECILEDKAGNIWFGGRTNKGVYRYDGRSITWLALPEITLPFETRSVTHGWGWPQLQDKQGNIWFGNWAGAYRYDGKTFKTFTTADGLPGYNGIVAKIIQDRQGNLYFGGDGGLSRYDGRSFTTFKDGLRNTWIWSMVEDKTGNIWVGTRQTGLYLFNGKNFINYSDDSQ